jgi:MerR family transcriptional regulator, light-induced transcriptional regulator
MPDREPRHTIGVVSRRTGLTIDLIRAWERRYQAIEPWRDEKDRRLYSDADVERLLLLRSATAEGRPIRQVAGLPNRELEALIDEDRTAAVRRYELPGEPAQGFEGDGDAAAELLDRCVEAIRVLNGQALEAHLDQATLELSRTRLLEELLVPLMHRVGDLWQEGDLRPAHEHLASAVVRSFVGSLRSAYRASPSAPRIVCATPTGQRHEMGVLLAALTAASEGWDVTYLGPDLPAEEIAAAVAERGAKVVALSLTYPPDDPQMAHELPRLDRLLEPQVALLVGGRAAPLYQAVLVRTRALHLEDYGDFRRELRRLRGPRRDDGQVG